MKNKVIYSYIFTIIILIMSGTVHSQWVITGNLSGMTGRPAVSIADENTIWTVGGLDGNPGTPVIYKTTNGGTNWVSISATNIRNNLACVYATNTNTCFVGDANSTGGYSRIYRTINGGTSWTAMDSVLDNGNGGFGAIKFSSSNPSFGIATCGGPLDSVVILKTFDGGVTWSRIQIPLYPGAGLPYSSLNVIDSSFYSFGTTGVSPRINITTNGGVTWNSYSTGLDSSGGNFTRGIAFSSDKLTGIAGATTLPTIARTTNGGLNWTNITIGSFGPSTSTPVMRWIEGTNICYMSSPYTTSGVLKSTNAGLNWTQMTTSGTGVFNFDVKKIGAAIYGFAISGVTVLKFSESLLNGKRFFGNCTSQSPIVFSKSSLSSSGSISTFGPGTTFQTRGMEFDNTGTLYCINRGTNPVLQTMDTATGILTPLGAITGITTPNQNTFALCFNTVNNKMYMSAFENGISVMSFLYTLDLNTRVATYIGTSGYNLGDIAINSSGQCFGYSVTNFLINVDLATGNHSSIGNLGYNSANSIQALCFDRETDVLYITAWNNDLSRAELRSVNILTGNSRFEVAFNPNLGSIAGFAMPFKMSVGIHNISNEIPESFFLGQNYPNPFNPVTNLEFGISNLGFVSLKVYDNLGREVTTLVNSDLSPGKYKYDFDGSNLPSGVYFYKLDVNEFSETKSMILLK